MTSHLIAVVAPGLESICAREIRALGGGIGKTRSDRGGRVHFEGPADALYRANLLLRTAERILVPLCPPFMAIKPPTLVDAVAALPIERCLRRDEPLRVLASVRGCALYHTGLIESAVREGLARRGFSALPPGEEAQDVTTLDVRGTGDSFTVTIDSSGAGLHRRGYRKATATAPLRETLAAASLYAVGYTGEQPFLDPMCGSGTFLGEAVGIATRRPVGLDRPFQFESFPSFDALMWREVVGQAVARQRPPPASIVGADGAAAAVRAARENIERTGLADAVRVVERRLHDTPRSKDSTGVVLTNPPYGKRLNSDRDARAAEGEWRSWGQSLRDRLPGWALHLVSPEARLAAAAGATGRPILRFSNGGIPVAVVAITRSGSDAVGP